MTLISKKLERVQLTNTQISLVIPRKVYDQCKYLCTVISEVEWSGVLFYSVKGSIKDPSKMVLTVEDILPMHKGSTGYTEYSFDERVINHIMDNEEAEDWKMGHIHSHNNMNVYFSGTDWSELEDNSPNHNFYLSLIVNNKMEFCAKVAFIVENQGETRISFVAKDEDGIPYEFTKENEADKKLVTYDCKVTPQSVAITKSFKDKVDGIITTAKRSKTVTYGSFGRGTFASHLKDVKKKRKGYPGRQTVKTRETFDWGKTDLFKDPEPTMNDFKEDYDIEDFMLYVLNGGKKVDNQDVDDILDSYKNFNIDPHSFAQTVIENYLDYYIAYHPKEDSEDMEKFVDNTENLIECISSEIYLTHSQHNVSMLTPVLQGVGSLLENLKTTS
jgi:hypothetical protein